MNENKLEPIKVGELLKYENGQPKYQFYIPAYQRGYRWGEEQVKDLLNDITEFIQTKKDKDKYCLQPVVVRRTSDGRYEVLDGQQRLTTIFILLTCLKKGITYIKHFSLEYETRPKSGVFLANLVDNVSKNQDLCNQNPDYFYISQAYITIDNWIKEVNNNNPEIFSELHPIIVKSLEFIWYEVNTTKDIDAIDIFTRINIGKISLTNAELVKAIFLSKNNLSIGAANTDYNSPAAQKILDLKKSNIALEWDLMEKTLQNPNIWGFIYSGKQNYETKLDYILELVSGKSQSSKNKYATFKYFYDKVKEIRSDKKRLDDYAKRNTSFIEEQWDEIRRTFDVLIEWYKDKKYNHLIGFLIFHEHSVRQLMDTFNELDRGKFHKHLRGEINKLIGSKSISELRYGDDSKTIKKILIFHNVFNSLTTEDEEVLFPFAKLNDQNWSLEHIFAQNSDELREKDYKKWAEDHLKIFKSKQESEEIKKIIGSLKSIVDDGGKKVAKDKFENCFKIVTDYVQEQIDKITTITSDDDWLNEEHSIANLALLDGGSNSALSNSLFDIKRQKIIAKDKEGLYIPNETKKVFFKYYTEKPDHLAYWTYKDRKAYVADIQKSLNYLK